MAYLCHNSQVVGGSSSVGATAIEILRLALPDSTILTTCSSPHFENAIKLGATQAFDSRAGDVLKEIRTASPGGRGVEVIFDSVDGVAAQPQLMQLLIGPKQFAEVATGSNVDPKTVPEDVKHQVGGMVQIMSKPLGASVAPALTDLLADEKYKLPIRAEVAGKGLEGIEPGLRKLMKGVSGTKLVIQI